MNKTARTKYLDREISKGVHQKIQGGYGKYQGTWVPYQTGVDLARSFEVLGLLEPVFSLQAHAAQMPLQNPQAPIAGVIDPQQGSTENGNVNRGLVLPSPSPGQGRSLASVSGMNRLANAGLSAQSPFSSTSLDNSNRTPSAHSNSLGRPFEAGSSRQGVDLHQSAYNAMPGAEGMMYAGPPMTPQPGFYPTQAPSAHPHAPHLPVQHQMLPPQGSYAQFRAQKRPYEEGLLEGASEMPTHDPGLYFDQYGRSYVLEDDGRPLKRSRADTTGVKGSLETMPELTQQDLYNQTDAMRSPLPLGTRLSSRPSRPRHLADSDQPVDVDGERQKRDNSRAKLLAIFEAEETTEVDLDTLLAPSPAKATKAEDPLADITHDSSREGDDSGLDIDQVIDDRGHTALHWAAALARDGVIAQLIKRGADVHRGNFVGESALIRAVLTTNNADRNNLGALLDNHLGESIKTIDNNHRTVLHHVALVAGIKGRATSANYYMSTLLEWIALHEDENMMKALVNSRDLQGDTPLNVAARVGNKNLVKLLLEAGADPSRANKIGLRPTDYGLDVPVGPGIRLRFEQS